MIDSMQPKMADCQNKTHALMGDCIHCVNDLCQNRIRKCRGSAKVVLPASGGVSVSNHQNEAGESTVTICSILQDNSKSCQTIMNPDGIMVSSISNMGNTLQVHLHGAVNDLGGNVGTFINGMQTFIGGFSPSSSSLNASEWQALQRAGEQYGKIAMEIGQQMAQMGRNMEHSMNNFAQQMNHGMNQMAVGMTDMFNNMANSFGQWQVPNQPINVPSVVNIHSQVPGNTQSVVNINSHVGGYETPVVQSPMNFQSFDMQMPAFPSVVNVNSQINTQSNIPASQSIYHNSQPASANSVVRVNNKVVHQTNSNIPRVVNINTHIKNKNGKTKRKQNVNLNMGTSVGAFDGNAFAASINNHIANVFSNIFGRKKRAVTTTTTTTAAPGLSRFRVSSRRSRRRKSKSRSSQRGTTTTTTAAPVGSTTTAASSTTPAPAIKTKADQIVSVLEQGIVDRFTQPSKETPKETTVIIEPPKTSELSFDPEVITQKIGTTERIANSHDDSPALQALLGVILPDEAYGFPIEVPTTTESPITPLSLGIQDLFKSMTVPPRVQSAADVADCGTIVIDPDSCVKYKSQCGTCAEYIDKNKGDILKRVCGDKIVKNGNKLTEKLDKLNEVYNQVIASSNLLTKVEFQQSLIDPATLSVTGVQVTALIKGEPLRFSAKAPLFVFDMAKTAKTLSKQIWQYWSPSTSKMP